MSFQPPNQPRAFVCPAPRSVDNRIFAPVIKANGLLMAVAYQRDGEAPTLVNLFREPGRDDGRILVPLPPEGVNVSLLIFNPTSSAIGILGAVEGVSIVNPKQGVFEPTTASCLVINPGMEGEIAGYVNVAANGVAALARWRLQPVGYGTTVGEATKKTTDLRGQCDLYVRTAYRDFMRQPMDDGYMRDIASSSGNLGYDPGLVAARPSRRAEDLDEPNWDHDKLRSPSKGTRNAPDRGGTVQVGIGTDVTQEIEDLQPVSFCLGETSPLCQLWIVARSEVLRSCIEGHLGHRAWNWECTSELAWQHLNSLTPPPAPVVPGVPTALKGWGSARQP